MKRLGEGSAPSPARRKAAYHRSQPQKITHSQTRLCVVEKQKRMAQMTVRRTSHFGFGNGKTNRPGA